VERAVSVTECRERERESVCVCCCEDRWLMDVKLQEVDALCDMWVVPTDINLTILNNTPHFVRNIDKHGIMDCKIRLSLETLDNVFENDVNSTYSFFLNSYLRVFYSSSPLRKLITKSNSNAWTATGIRTSCKHKRELYLLCKGGNDPLLNIKYAKFCQMT
jgi:hypothetical protein